ncbi:MAG: redoxin domain-containing protein [Planctomycetaceae bacterium]|nr:redoxin domain-containing protein [Planctomycetaceae bacterium]
MFRVEVTIRFLTVALGCLICQFLSNSAHAQVGVETVLAYTPSQRDVDYEVPSKEDGPKCKLEVERMDNGSGWVLYSPEGQILRRFLDSDGNQRVDQYRYYKHGLEVFRDIDTDGNNQVDQSRWFNTNGTRWGIDQDEDGKIERWKVISAEEASREAIQAFITRDDKRLAAVLITPEDCRQLGLSETVTKELLERVSNHAAKMKTVLGSTKLLGTNSRWTRFDCSMLMPSLIPAEKGKSSQDLVVYENVMAMVDSGAQPGFVQVGEMVRIGDVWKLTQIPQPFEGNNATVAEGGVLLQPSMVAAASASEGLSPEMQKLVTSLQELDNKAPTGNASREDITRYNLERAKLLNELSQISTTAEERSMWQRQRLEGIAAATQMKTYPNGLEELKQIEQQFRQQKVDKNLLAFATFQRLLADYNLQLETAEANDRAKVQENWLMALEGFAQEFPDSPDSADALLQLGMTYEFNGNIEDARKWYSELVQKYPQTASAQKGKGALNRLELKGKRLPLRGKALQGGTIDLSAYQGKVTAVIFWATWCKPCTEDLPQILELYRKYRPDGFEIVGINLDAEGAPIQQYIDNFKIPWYHIHEDGGLESRPAIEFGVISLPTMFLVDRSGTVVSSSATVDDLKKLVPELVKR